MNSAPAQPSIDLIERKLERDLALATLDCMAAEDNGDTCALAFAEGARRSAARALIAHRTAHTPKAVPARCEPPDVDKGERYHWLMQTAGNMRPTIKPWRWSGGAWSNFNHNGGPCAPELLASLGWKYHSVALPSPNIEHIADAGKEIEFRWDAAIWDEVRAKHRKAIAEGVCDPAVYLVDWALRTFKPLPAQVRVEPTKQEIEIAAQAIYDDFEPPAGQEKPQWQLGGNSHKQTEARIYARSALTAARALLDGDRA